MTNLDSILKSRDITLPTRVRLVKAMVFPVVMYGCESWTVRKAECQRTDTFELWCWRRFLRVPWTARDQTSQSKNKSTLNIYGKEWCWSWSCTPLATWCKEPTHWKRPWCWERLKAGEEGGDRGRDGWMASLTQRIWIWARSRRWWRAGKPGVLQTMGSQQVGHGLATELQQQQRGRKDDIFSLVAENDVHGCIFFTVNRLPISFLWGTVIFFRSFIGTTSLHKRRGLTGQPIVTVRWRE